MYYDVGRMRPDEPQEQEILYAESVSLEPWLKALILVILALYFVLFILMVIKSNVALSLAMGVLLALVIFLQWNFSRLSFEITEKEVRFGFGIFMKKYPREMVISCEPYTLKFSNYLGYGIRFGFDGTIAYNTRMGPGVKLTVEGEKRAFVLSINGVERACEILSRSR